MKKIILLIWIIFSASANAQNGEGVYQNYCAGCHGNNLKGKLPLIKLNWKNGGDKESIINSITNGVTNTQMISWNKILSSKDIENVTDYILKSQNKKVDNTVSKNRKIIKTKHYSLKVETVVSNGLNEPWGIEFIDKTKAIISQKIGKLSWMVNGKLDSQNISGVPKTFATTIYGGYMDVALDPKYKKNGWIYLAFSHNPSNSTDNNTPGMTKIVRGKVVNHKWMNEETLFEVSDSVRVSMGMRWGCRFLFDNQGYLYFTIGDMQQIIQSGNNPQLFHRPEGKIYRINPDGTIPKDNPLYGKSNVLQAIYAWGTRNVQGIAQNKSNGKIYFSDHGPQGGDEINLLKKGANYGWPLITYGVNYDNSPVSKDTTMEGMEQPITYYTPSIAVCAVEIVNSKLFPKWGNDLLLTALKNQELRRLVIKDNKVVEDEILLKNIGRVRDVKIGPDGAIYVLTNAPDSVLKITPLK